MTSEPSYTNVRMDANSPLGQWWRHQSDRDYSMQVLVQLANQKFGENVDLKAYSLQQMINSNVAPAANQLQTPVEETPESKPANRAVVDQPVQLAPDKLPPTQPATAPNPEPTAPQTSAQPTTPNSASTAPDDDALVHDALFGGAAKPVKKARKPGQSFRDQL